MIVIVVFVSTALHDKKRVDLRDNEFLKEATLIAHEHKLTNAGFLAVLRLLDKSLKMSREAASQVFVPLHKNTMKKYCGEGVLTGMYNIKCPNEACGGVYTSGEVGLGLQKVLCGKCKRIPKYTEDYFISLSIRTILEVCLADVHPLITQMDNNNEGVRRLKAKVGDFDDANDIIILLNTDGIKLTNSTYPSAWPLLFSIYGIPERHRNTLTNMFLAAVGMHFAGGNLEIGAMLWQFKEQLLAIRKRPIQWTDETGRQRFSKVYLLGVCCDAPARAKAAFMQQYNGTYGCTRCLHKGNWEEDWNKEFHLRTMEEYLQDGEKLKHFQLNGTEEEKRRDHFHGVKGKTPLADLPEFDVPTGKIFLPVEPHKYYTTGVYFNLAYSGSFNFNRLSL